MSPESATLDRLEESASAAREAGPIGRRSPHPVWFGIGSGLALWAAFPPAEWHGFAWVALVPLFLLVRSTRVAWAYVSAGVGGLIFWLLVTEWVRLTDPAAWPAWILMAAVLAIFWPLFLGLARWGVGRLGLPMMIAAPVVWVALEYVRAYFMTGFPWYYLAHTQFRRLEMIQISDFAGAWGVSLLIAASNACIVELLQVPLLRPAPTGPRLPPAQIARLAVIGTALVFTYGYGAYRIRTAEFTPGPTVALLQSNLIQTMNSGRDPNATTLYYVGLVERAAASGKKLDLAVWPETSYPFGFVEIEPKLNLDELDAQVKELGPDGRAADWIAKRDSVSEHLHAVTDRILGAPMMVGTVVYDFRVGGRNRYNAAVLFEPGESTVQAYRKMHLVPFGEYVPLIRTFPWLTYLTPYRGSRTPSLSFGERPAWLDQGPWRYAVAICFEDTLPQVVRPLIADVPDGRPPDVLVNQSNDGWFHDSTAEHVMHLACSVFRAVEHRIPLARSANTGISAVVDGNGRIVSQLETGTEAAMIDGVLIENVPLDPRSGLYTRWGDWLPIGCLAITLGGLPLGRLRRFRDRSGSRSSAPASAS
jgi:apolipoprotein N-acyltransferase